LLLLRLLRLLRLQLLPRLMRLRLLLRLWQQLSLFSLATRRLAARGRRRPGVG